MEMPAPARLFAALYFVDVWPVKLSMTCHEYIYFAAALYMLRNVKIVNASFFIELEMNNGV